MKRSVLIVLLLSLTVLSSGCVVLALGAGAAGGYAISKDEVEGFSDQSMNKVWQKAQDVLKEEGDVKESDEKAGTLKAEVGSSEVKFTVEQVSPKSVRLRVRARKMANMFPDMDLAQGIYNKISKKIS